MLTLPVNGYVCNSIVSNVNAPLSATGDWRPQCLPCGGGYLPGVLRLGTAHHPDAYGKPVFHLHPLSHYHIQTNYGKT